MQFCCSKASEPRGQLGRSHPNAETAGSKVYFRPRNMPSLSTGYTHFCICTAEMNPKRSKTIGGWGFTPDLTGGAYTLLRPPTQGRKPGGKFGGRWQTAFGSKLLTRKTGRVETSDTV